MTADHVQKILGPPRGVEQHGSGENPREEWKYDWGFVQSGSVYFEHGRVVEIEIREG